MSECIFCKIASGEIPCHRVYENDNVLAFLDNRPVNYGHTLIIPKEHHENMIDTPVDILCEIMAAAKKLAPAILKATELHDYNFVANSGTAAGQIVFHTHFHIIPRFEGDGYGRFRVENKEGQAEEIAEKIRNKIS
jgi:histidine triad (HIT) family protein